jgi:hypothetical protein
MNKITSTTVILGFTFVVVLLSYFALTIEVVEENGNYKKNSYVKIKRYLLKKKMNLLL